MINDEKKAKEILDKLIQEFDVYILKRMIISILRRSKISISLEEIEILEELKKEILFEITQKLFLREKVDIFLYKDIKYRNDKSYLFDIKKWYEDYELEIKNELKSKISSEFYENIDFEESILGYSFSQVFDYDEFKPEDFNLFLYEIFNIYIKDLYGEDIKL